MNCPRCHSLRTNKNGRNELGHQRYRCRDCHASWGEGKPKKVPADIKEQALKL